MDKIDWPSKNVCQGGILHPAKTRYSPDTHQFLKVLVEESKMTMMQRKPKNYNLRNGQPLPAPWGGSRKIRSRFPEVTIKPGSSKRRSRSQIISSGAYEIEPVRPLNPGMDREREKDKLANKMAYNKDIVVTKEKLLKKIEKEEVTVEKDRFDQLADEIKERKEWIKEMEGLGNAEKFRLIINQQIQSKVSEMQKIAGANGEEK